MKQPTLNREQELNNYRLTKANFEAVDLSRRKTHTRPVITKESEDADHNAVFGSIKQTLDEIGSKRVFYTIENEIYPLLNE